MGSREGGGASSFKASGAGISNSDSDGESRRPNSSDDEGEDGVEVSHVVAAASADPAVVPGSNAHPTKQRHDAYGLEPKKPKGAYSIWWRDIRKYKHKRLPGEVVCILCVEKGDWASAQFGAGGGTSNLRSHYTSHHNVSSCGYVAHFL
jgi:hypothetical protein